MSNSYSKWSDVKARGRAADPRTEDEKAVGKTRHASAGKRTCADTNWQGCA